MSDNTLELRGQLAADPELRYTQGGKAVAQARVGSSHRYKRGEEWIEETVWMRVTAWGALAENFAGSCVKGTRVMVVGRLNDNSYEKDDGTKVHSVELIAEEIGVSLKFTTAKPEVRERTTQTRRPQQQRREESTYGDEPPF